ncbi:MAG: hypothetical protein GY940_39395 [bacterium]|nr:hypothetical protein [bacterium]
MARNGAVYVIANDIKELLVYHNGSGFRPLNLEGITDIAWDMKYNRLYILKDRRIGFLETDSPPMKKLPIPISRLLPSGIHSIHIDYNGNIFLSAGHRTVKIDAKGNVLERFTWPGESSGLLAVDKNENLYCAIKAMVLKFDKKGKLIASFRGIKEFAKISSIAVDDSERIWVLNKDICFLNFMDGTGKMLGSVEYNRRRKVRGWKPFPARQVYLAGDNLLLVDNWEGIVVYTIGPDK